jgi:N-acetylglucosamine kinase-like BadF-type ATPase
VTRAVLAVDAGQTEIRVALADGERGPGSDGVRTPGVLRMGRRVGPDEVAAALVAAVAELGPLPDPPPPLGVGLSGFEAAADADLRRVGELLRERLTVERLAIASDGLTSLLGALGSADGAVVAAGTGTVAVARRGERLAKVDGWGALLGDAGSGFAIGRAGIELALREADGRGGSAALLRAAEERYAPVPDLSERIYAAEVPTRAVAAFAADVAREAEAGDGQAVAILEEAAGELALSACAALGHLFEPEEPAVVSYAGNVFLAGTVLLEPFRRAVAEVRPGTEVRPPEADGLAGAAVLAAEDELRPEPGLLWRSAA